VVTGANSGIGLQITKELNKRGATVHVLCRDRERGEAAMSELAQHGCNATRLVLHLVDLTDFSTIRRFADQFKKENDKLDMLINNAGIMFYPKFEKTIDGFEKTWQSNYLGHFLLTELLMAPLKKAGGRIVNVSSQLHGRGKAVDLAYVNEKKNWGRFMPYQNSKLAQVMHARELTRRLRQKEASHVTINACHPGACATNLPRHTLFNMAPIKALIAPFMWYFFKTERDGAHTELFLALSSRVDGISGRYFADCKEKTMENPLALDENACSVLYNESLVACGLNK